ncbi:MAG: hypothetical protein SVR81_03420 [Chloroflexota bacterium]|nr:hypothetical protein [Chloroflexota bacterium]
MLLIIMALVSLGTLLALAAGWMNPTGELLLFYLLPPLTFIFFIVYTSIRLRRQARNVAAKDQESRWQVSAEGIIIDKSEGEEEFPWHSFSYAQGLPGQFIFFFAANRPEYIYISAEKRLQIAGAESSPALADGHASGADPVLDR